MVLVVDKNGERNIGGASGRGIHKEDFTADDVVRMRKRSDEKHRSDKQAGVSCQCGGSLHIRKSDRHRKHKKKIA